VKVGAVVIGSFLISSLFTGCATSIDYSKYANQDCSYDARTVNEPSDTGIALILAPSSTFSSLDQFASGAGSVLTPRFGTRTTVSTYVVGESSALVSQEYVDNSGSIFGSNASNSIDLAVTQGVDSARCFVAANLQTGEQDILSALDLAGSGLNQSSETKNKEIFVYTNGLQTSGNLMMQDAFGSGVEDIVNALDAEGALPNLDGVTVNFYGLGQMSGEQPVFSSKSRNHLREIWKSIIERSGGKFVDGGPVSIGKGNPSAPPVSLVQPLQSKPIVASCKAVLTDENLSFQANSADFLNPALAQLSISQVASSLLSDNCSGVVKVTGYTTNFSSEAAQKKLSKARANSVANSLREFLPNAPVEVQGKGYDGSGELDQSNRRVEIEVSGN
jgi:outer membrane protein OmpA-like peptidoglycan-associated protein